LKFLRRNLKCEQCLIFFKYLLIFSHFFRIQEEREERHRLKKVLGLQEIIKLPPKPGDDLRASLSLELGWSICQFFAKKSKSFCFN
jgi:hypothetical protein